MSYVIGIDPGAKDTGVVLRHGGLLLDSTTVHNGAYPDLPDLYLQAVIDRVGGLRYDVRLKGEEPVVALEAVEAPNPHMGTISVVALLGTAQVVGAVRAFYRCVMVAPGKNGSLPLAYYPADLVGPRERGPYSNGKLRHVRSAWDVAGKAESVLH